MIALETGSVRSSMRFVMDREQKFKDETYR